MIQAAVLGLTDPRFNLDSEPQFIPNMDGFPNGRRLEDDVTRIELQAVSGIVLAAIGLWYDDFDAEASNPVTQDLLDVLTYSTGVEQNDATFEARFPYVATPWSGDGECSGIPVAPMEDPMLRLASLNIGAPQTVNSVSATVYPNPFVEKATIQLDLEKESDVLVEIYNSQGQLVEKLQGNQPAGRSELAWQPQKITPGWYFARISASGMTEVIKLLNQE